MCINFLRKVRTESVKELDVNFYDYNGERLYSYTADNFLKLYKLPKEPSHEGLINYGWTYTLDEAKEFVEKYGKLDIGMQYTTDDGHTRIIIELLPGNLSPILNLQINSNINIDWGDGNTEVYEYSSEEAGTFVSVSVQHIYSSDGKYIIKITPENDGQIKILGTSSSSKILTGERDRQYLNCIKEIWLGNNVILSNYGLQYLGELQSILISYGITSLNSNCLNGVNKLKSIIMPNSIEKILNQAFAYNHNLELAILSRNLSFVDSNIFYYDVKLKHLIIDTKLTSITALIYATSQVGSTCDYIIFSDNITTISGISYQFTLEKVYIPKNIIKINEAMTFIETLEKLEISNPNLGEDETLIISNSFTFCYKLNYIKMTNVTSITSSFKSCSSLAIVDFSETTRIPTISSVSFPSTVTIIVPDDLYDEWIATESWSAYVDNIVKASEYENLK